MPLIHQTPISMKALNFNIDDNLNFTTTYGKIQVVGTDGILILQPDTGAWVGSSISLLGSNASVDKGYINLSTSDGAGSLDILAQCVPRIGAASPYLKMRGFQIKNLADPTAAQDAATKNYADGLFPAWATWVPTVTWTGGTPTGVSSSKRYTQIGKTVFFEIDVNATDSQGVTALTITVPVTLPGTMAPVYSGQQGYGAGGATWGNPLPMTTLASPSLIQFRAFQAATSGQPVYVRVTGFYEVS
jgi:hypothetical protein